MLWSDPLGTNPRELLTFDTKLLLLGTDVLLGAHKNDAAALAEAGRFMLYEAGNLPQRSSILSARMGPDSLSPSISPLPRCLQAGKPADDTPGMRFLLNFRLPPLNL